MGILNVTPDSFSDGGLWLDPESAVARGEELVRQGATIIDVGGESTRPGADPVTPTEELRRVVPVIDELAKRLPDVTISIDTAKAVVAKAAIDVGATYVNDVTAFTSDPEMLGVVAAHPHVRCCLMHMQGAPRTMQHDPQYGDVVADVEDYLRRRLEEVVEHGIPADRIDLDPGIGFGKRNEHNLRLLRHLDRLVAIGPAIVLGTSRKSTLGRITGRTEPAELVAASVATSVLGYERGVRIFRVHDVAEHRDALLVAEAVLHA
ncbi:MAG: dihydropteroate synthase [Solirubrobacteraceae bacterium]|nr:dihydropteroate synthase [Solirubrobacteraceae bacterium]